MEYMFPTVITISIIRPLWIDMWSGNLGGANHVHIRTVILGFI
jgi:hypothetical protein